MPSCLNKPLFQETQRQMFFINHFEELHTYLTVPSLSRPREKHKLQYTVAEWAKICFKWQIYNEGLRISIWLVLYPTLLHLFQQKWTFDILFCKLEATKEKKCRRKQTKDKHWTGNRQVVFFFILASRSVCLCHCTTYNNLHKLGKEK